MTSVFFLLFLIQPSWKHLLWLIVAPVVFWPLKAFWGWMRHCFWLGFKANFAATMKKGSKLTPEEEAVVKQQVQAQIDAEVNAKIHAIADPLGINLPNANPTPTQTLPPDIKS